MILLPACFGGGSQSCDAQFCGTSSPRTAAAPAPVMMPDPVTDPDPIPTPAFATLGEFGMTSTGGAGRVLYMTNDAGNAVDTNNMEVTNQNGLTPASFEVDDKEAVLLIISDTAINALLQAPLTTKLLDNDASINYANADNTNRQDAIMTGTTGIAINARGESDAESGMLYTLEGTTIYIDSHAPVVLGSEIGDTSSEIVTIGEPFSRTPATLDVFSGTYSGVSIVARTNASPETGHNTRSTFDMTVEFDTTNMTSSISNFTADFGVQGSVEATTIPIDNDNGTFDSTNGGTVTLTAAPFQSAIINSSFAGPGTFFGQFHGTDANGVTGAFHNSTDPATTAPTIFGGFAGSKE